MKRTTLRKVFSSIFILIYLLTAPGVLVAPARATDYGSSVTVESGQTFQPEDGIANITGSLTNKNGGTVIADTINTTTGWTLAEGSVTQVNTLTNGTDLTAMSKIGTVNGDVYASSGTLDMRGVDLRLKGDPLLHGGTVENPTTLDTLKATKVLFGDIYEGGNYQKIKNIVLENEATAYRAALGVYYDALDVETISVNAPEGWYWDQQYQGGGGNSNYQMYTGFGGTLNVSKSMTSGEIMNAGYSIGGTGIMNFADGAVINCVDFQNTGNMNGGTAVTDEKAAENIAAGIVHVNGAGATLNAAVINNHAITTLGTVNLTSHSVLTTPSEGVYGVNYGTGAVLTIGELNFLNKQGDTTKNQMRFGDNAKTIIGGLATNPAVGADFYVTQESDMSINKDGGKAVQYTGDIVFTTYGNAASDDTKVSMNLDSSDDYFTGAVKGTVTSTNRWGKWGSGVVGGETASTEHIKGMTLNVSNGATWNVTGDSFVNNLTVNDASVLDADGSTETVPTVTINGTTGTGTLNNASIATNVTNEGTLTVTDKATISSTLTNKGKLNLSDANHTVGTNLSVDTFTGSATGSIDFDADISGTKQDTDYITVTTAASGNVALGHVNIKADAPTTEGKTLALFRDNPDAEGTADFSDLNITGSAITATSSGKIYKFEQDTESGATARGNLVQKQLEVTYTLPEIIQNRVNTEIHPTYEPGNITTYSLVGDYTAPENLGTLTRVTGATTRDLMINGNGNNFSGAGYTGVTVNSGDTLTLKDLASFGGFRGENGDTVVANSGTLNINNTKIDQTGDFNSNQPAGVIANKAGGVVNISGTSEIVAHNTRQNAGAAIGNAEGAVMNISGTVGFSGYGGNAFIYNQGTINAAGSTINGKDIDGLFISNSGAIDSINGTFDNASMILSNAATGTVTNLGSAASHMQITGRTATGTSVQNAGNISNIYADYKGNNGTAINNNGGNIGLISGTFGSEGNGNMGASVINNGGTITEIKDSVFSYNTGANSGAAISNTGTITNISGTNFLHNSAGHGGAIASSGNITVNGAVAFTENAATNTEGGAIFNSGNFTIAGNGEDVSFTDNTAVTGGGAVSARAGAFSITGADEVSFSGNKAGTDGGAIYNGNATGANGVVITAEKIKFVGNEANGSSVSGGAIYNNNAELSLVANEVVFSGNKDINTGTSGEKYGGGAIYNRNTENHTIVIGKAGGTTEFTANESEKVGGAIGIRATGTGAATMTMNGATTFSGNSANLSGGAIWNKVEDTATSTIEFTDKATFTDNSATGTASNGGAIDNYGTIVFDNGSTFTGNSAGSKGGAISNEASAATITFNGTNEFSGNTANGVANDIYNVGVLNFANGSVTNFGDGTAENFGGGITGAGSANIAAGAVVNFNGTETKKITVENSVENAGTMAATNTSFNSITNTGTMVASDTTFNNGLISKGENAVATINNATLAGGTYSATLDESGTGGKGKIVMVGGTLATTADEGSLASKISGVDKGFVLTEAGVIDTYSNQIFENALTAKGTKTNASYIAENKNSGAVIANQIDFQGGSLQLNDANYTVEYAATAKGALTNASSLGEGKGLTSLIMMGDLVNPEGEINVTTVDAIDDKSATITEYDKATALTLNGSLLVGTNEVLSTLGAVETIEDSTGITVRDTSATSISVNKLNLAQKSTGIIVTNDKYLTLGGSEGKTKEVEVVEVAEKLVDVDVVVGLDEATAELIHVKQEGTLNVGNSQADATAKYALAGNVTVNDTYGTASNRSKLNVKGQVGISQNLTLSGADVNIANGGQLNVSGTTKVLAAASGQATNISGTIKGDKLVNDGTLQAKASDLQYTTIENNSIHTLKLGDGAIAADITTTAADGRGAVVVDGVVTATGKTIKNQNVAVNADKWLTLAGVTSTNTNYANEGTMNLDTTESDLGNGITGAGTTNVNVSTTLTGETKIEQKNINIDNNATLSATRGNLSATDGITVATGSALKLGNGNVKASVSGEGNTNVEGFNFVDGTVTTETNVKGGLVSQDKTAVGNNNRFAGTSTNSIAIGNGNNVSHNNAVVIGNNITTAADDTVAIGTGASATAEHAVAIGANNATGNYSVAMGSGTTASNEASTAMGYGTTASGAASTAMGAWTTASGWESTAMGLFTTASGHYSTAMGIYTMAKGDGSFAGGVGAEEDLTTPAPAQALGTSSFAYGTGVTSGAGHMVDDPEGAYWKSDAGYTVAMGYKTGAYKDYAVAMGYQTNASGNSSVAMGAGTTASGTASTAIGAFSQATGAASFAGGVDTSFGEGTGTKTNASGNASFAYGVGVNASGDAAVAFGFGNNASGQGAFTAGGVKDGGTTMNANTASGRNAVAFGEGSTASGIDSFAMGSGAGATGNYSVAMGQSAAAAAENSFAFGGTVTGTATNSVALGQGSSVTGTATNSVALGANSVASGANEISVGKAGATRKITNVTAGDISSTSTDVVIGSQLNATNKSVATNTANIATNKGNIETLQGYFNDSGVANKATADAYGKDINSTYAKSEYVASTYATKTAVADTYATKTALGETNTKVTTLQGNFEADGTTAKKATTATTAESATKDSYGTTINASSYAKSADVASTYATNTALGNEINRAKAAEAVKVSKEDGSTITTNLTSESGIEIAAGENIELSTSGNKLTIKSLGGTDAQAVHYTTGTAANDSIVLTGVGGTTISNVKKADLAENGTYAATTGQVHAEQEARKTATTMSEKGNYYAKGDGVTTALGNVDKQVAANTTAIGTKANQSDFTAHTGNTAAHITSAERTAWNAYDERITTNTDNISTLQSYFNDSGVANKATADAYGKDINSTYAKSEYVASTYATKTELGTKADQTTVNGTYKNASYADNKLTFTKVDGTTDEVTITSGGAGSDTLAVHYDKVGETRQNSITLKGVAACDKVAISNVAAQALEKDGTYAATTGQVYAEQQARIAASVTQGAVAGEGSGQLTLKNAEGKEVANINLSGLKTEQGNTNAENITKIVNGSTVVGKATADGNGDVIATTYAKSADVASTYATKTELSAKADTTYVNAELNKKANAADVYTKTDADAKFATQTALGETNERLTTAEGSITALQGDVKTVKGDVSKLQDNFDASGKAKEAVHASTADSATTATTAESATKDGSGNIIADTYATKTAVADTYATKDALNSKANVAATNIKVTNGSQTWDNVNAGSGVEFIAGKNVTLSATGNQITINATGGTGGSDIAEYTGTHELTFKDSSGSTTSGKITLKNVQIDTGDSGETGGTTTKLDEKGITVSGGSTAGSTTTVITAEGIKTGNTGDGIKYVDAISNTVAENLKALDKQVTMISANQANIGDDAAHDKAASATAAEATAVGYMAQATNKRATAVGYGNTASGERATAVGYGNTVSGARSGAFGDPNVVTGSGSYAIGNDNEIKGNNNFVLGNEVKVDATVENSVALGNGSTVTESNVVSVGNETEGGQRRITNVAAGRYATDAATVGQLASVDQRVTNVQNQVAENSKETREVGAMSAALAGLHYVEPSGEGDDKFTGAVAYGGFRGESAAALGVAYKPSPNLMVSASTSVGNNQNMYNAGVAFKFGPGKTINKVALQKQVKYLNDKNSELSSRLDSANAKIEQQGKENAELKETVKMLLERMEKLEKKVK